MGGFAREHAATERLAAPGERSVVPSRLSVADAIAVDVLLGVPEGADQEFLVSLLVLGWYCFCDGGQKNVTREKR